MIYAGPIYYWRQHQIAIAAARFPGHIASQAGIDLLQNLWLATGERMPNAGEMDRAWAIEALDDVRKRNPELRYEQVLA